MANSTLAKKVEYRLDKVPKDWNQKTEDGKMTWLSEQGLPGNPTVNLLDCYHRGAKLTHIFRIFFNLMKRLREAVINKFSAKLRKYFNAFAEALRQGVGRFSNYIFDNCAALLKNGKFKDGETPLTPVNIPDVPTIDDGDTEEKSSTTGKPFKDTFWGIIIDTLSVLTNSWPWLNKVQPGMHVSYAQLFKSVTDAGQAFFQEFTNAQGGDQPNDEGDAFAVGLVDNAVSDGLARNLQPSPDDESADEGGDEDNLTEIEELVQLAPVWKRVR